MQLDLELIFPIRDLPSAELMTLKAACLSDAGVIDTRQRKIVEQRAHMFLGMDEVTDGRANHSANSYSLTYIAALSSSRR
jgi:hypothetical protein